MARKNVWLIASALLIIIGSGCGGNDTKHGNTDTPTTNTDTSVIFSPKGVGKFQNVELTHPLDEKMVAQGKNVYEVKCQSCHKLTDEKLVGPGWKGVTDRRQPEWIMNFVTNVEEMLQKDTAAINMLQVCLVTMPNQNLSDEDARSVLEYMRKNDGKN